MKRQNVATTNVSILEQNTISFGTTHQFENMISSNHLMMMPPQTTKRQTNNVFNRSPMTLSSKGSGSFISMEKKAQYNILYDVIKQNQNSSKQQAEVAVSPNSYYFGSANRTEAFLNIQAAKSGSSFLAQKQQLHPFSKTNKATTSASIPLTSAVKATPNRSQKVKQGISSVTKF